MFITLPKFAYNHYRSLIISGREPTTLTKQRLVRIIQQRIDLMHLLILNSVDR